jgi:hypothetical protein
LRGVKCVPVVELSEKPMRTKYKMNLRPYCRIVDWKILGGDGGALPIQPVAPQLPASAPNGEPAKPQASETLEKMGDVKPVTTAEIVDDEILY